MTHYSFSELWNDPRLPVVLARLDQVTPLIDVAVEPVLTWAFEWGGAALHLPLAHPVHQCLRGVGFGRDFRDSEDVLLASLKGSGTLSAVLYSPPPSLASR